MKYYKQVLALLALLVFFSTSILAQEEEISTEIEDSRVKGEWEISYKTEQGTNAESFTIEFNFEDYENNRKKRIKG